MERTIVFKKHTGIWKNWNKYSRRVRVIEDYTIKHDGFKRKYKTENTRVRRFQLLIDTGMVRDVLTGDEIFSDVADDIRKEWKKCSSMSSNKNNIQQGESQSALNGDDHTGSSPADSYKDPSTEESK